MEKTRNGQLQLNLEQQFQCDQQISSGRSSVNNLDQFDFPYEDLAIGADDDQEDNYSIFANGFHSTYEQTYQIPTKPKQTKNVNSKCRKATNTNKKSSQTKRIAQQTDISLNEEKRQILLDIFKNNPRASTLSISKSINISRTKLTEIRKEYEETGNIRIAVRRNNNKSTKVMSDEKQKLAIRNIIKRNQRTGLQQLVQKLEKQYSIKLRRSIVHRMLTQEMGYSYQPLAAPNPPTPTLNSEDIILKRGHFCKSIQKHKLDQFYACGIATFLTNNKTNFTWVSKELKQSMASKEVGFDDSCTNIIVTLSVKEIVKYEFYSGSLSRQFFIDHIRKGFLNRIKKPFGRQLIIISEQICQQIYKKQQKFECPAKTEFSLKIEDYQHKDLNSSYNDKMLKENMNQINANYMVFPSFSPKINPCYHFFQKAQKKFRAYRILKKRLKTLDQIKAGLIEVMNLMPSSEHILYYKKISSYLSIKDIKVSHFIQEQAQ